jgi:ABC-2 type transport system ATP-binding protein
LLSDKIVDSVLFLRNETALGNASALLNDPEILILDEPTNGLDPQGIHQIRDIIKRIASQGTTILLASHLLDEVEKYMYSCGSFKKRRNFIYWFSRWHVSNEGF